LKFPLVEIRWDDAETSGGWEQATDLAPKHAEAITVGFLVAETADHVVIANTVGEDGSTNGRIQIPSKMILKRRTMRGAK